MAAEADVKSSEAALLRFITCGSVDDGKSTLIGRLLYDSSQVTDDHLEALDRDSRKFGTQGANLDFALLVDGLAAEREQGITIDVAYRYFKTDKRSFIVADTPGHEQYTRNMATGASTADLAVILIDARKGVLPQTRRHSFIVSMIGVRHVVLAVNKMDLVDYDQGRFDAIVAAYTEMAKGLRFETVQAIPLSALAGDNVTGPSDKTPWYRGPALLPYLEGVDVEQTALQEAAFRFPVQWVNRPNLDFRGFSGWIASGSVRPGDAIVALPSGRVSKVKSIVSYDGELPLAVAGQSVTLTMEDEIDISRGDIIAGVVNKPLVIHKAKALLLNTADKPLKPGATFVVKLAATTANATLSILHYRVDIHSFEHGAAADLAMNEIGLATLSFDKPLVTTDYDANRDLGGFILIDRLTNETAAFGLVTSAPEAAVTLETPAVSVASSLPSPSILQAYKSYRFGGADAAVRSQVAWKAISAMAVGSATLLMTGNALAAGAAALIDAVAMPMVRLGFFALTHQAMPQADKDQSAGGDGI